MCGILVLYEMSMDSEASQASHPGPEQMNPTAKKSISPHPRERG
jgi:hypothetical protein